MSSSMDGLSGVYSITSQIKALQEQQNPTDTSAAAAAGTKSPEEIILSLEQNFNTMLNKLISSGDEEDSNKSDPFADFFNTYNQPATTNTTATNSTTNSSDTSQQTSISNTVLGSSSLVNPYSGSLNSNTLGIENLYGDEIWKI